MKLIQLISIIACVASSGFCEPDEPPPDMAVSRTVEQAVTAQQLLDNALAQLPRKPILISGDIIVRKRRGVVVRKRKFDISVNWGADPVIAHYTIRDESGKDLEQLMITRKSGSAPEFRYAKGDPLKPADTPDMLETVQGSDMTWLDLTLSFLWWKGGVIKGSDEIRGFKCYMVDIPAPKDFLGQYSHVRLWIGKKINVMLQAEGYDSKGKLLRRLWVRSCKKTDNTWMVKDMEVQRFPVIHRTKLHINEVSSDTQL
ncbi:MAG: outer membrane lipoprotein-sorting protein [Kiritimatiellae bacterium]|nr:outer membrane lipoprotein-sorting protein [Kiritimatiellia bacterium]